MPSTTIIATLPMANANGAIDNLVEADFPEPDISLVTENSADARRIIADAGPLEGETAQTLAEALKQLGVPRATRVAELVDADTALIAVSADPDTEAAAREILRDAGATLAEPA